MISYEKYGPEYQKLWDTMRIIRDDQTLTRLSDKIKKHKAVYQKVESATGVPWQMVAVIHIREAGEQDVGRWLCTLHNGEKIIGTGRVTRLVPAGRGPFSDWLSAAIDAIKIKGFDRIAKWPVSRVLWALEPFNGYGYRNRGLRSPYLWASTNHQQRGKYVRDGEFDPNVMDTQIGCAALLKYLGFGVKTNPVPPVVGPVVIGTGSAVMWPEYIVPILIGTTITCVAGYMIYKWYNKRIKPREQNLDVDQGKANQVDRKDVE